MLVDCLLHRYVAPLGVLIEAKYVRKKEDVRPITDAIAADITKYGDNRYRILFFVYDPHHVVVDEAAFWAPILARENMLAALIR
jgi:hypothetical protein